MRKGRMRNRFWSTRRDISKELKIVELYKSGVSIKEILGQVGLSPQNRACIGEARRRHNVPHRGYPNRDKITTRKYYWDFDFFGRDSSETAYWAGFIMADGNIAHRGGTFHLSLSISIKDRGHLETFCSHLGLATRQIRERKRQTPYGFSHTCEILVTHPHLGKTLEGWGVIPRKTTEWISPQVSIGAIPHFLRGWFDGDGTINVKSTQAMSICSSHLVAMQWFADSLLALGYRGAYHISTQKNTTTLTINGILQMYSIYRLLYGNQSPRLDRKWGRIESYHSPRLDRLIQLGATLQFVQI